MARCYLLSFEVESMLEAKTQSQELKAKSQEPPFSHTPAAYLMAVAMYCSEMRPFQTHSSPLEAAEAGTQTVGHSPQGCWPFRGSPPMPLSVAPNNFQSLRYCGPN